MSSSGIEKIKEPLHLLVQEVLLVFLSALLFFLSHPSPLFPYGLGFLAYLSLVPLFYLVPKISWGKTLFYGPLAGFLSYASFNYWLAAFHPLALFLVPGIYTFYYFLLFICLKLVHQVFKEKSLIPFLILWLGYEYFRTQAFLGYPYGMIGYTQWIYLPLIQSADLFGIWFINLLVLFPSVFLGFGLSFGRQKWPTYWSANKGAAYVFSALFLLNLVYGFLSPLDYSQAPLWRASLIQHDLDPHQGGNVAYQNSLDRLRYWSDRAIKESDPQAVVWSETAFVPSVDFHTRYRTDISRFNMVKDLLDYLGKQSIPFIFGNDQGQLSRDDQGQEVRLHFNAALHFQNQKIQGTYRKTHLVPFTEHFPYKDTLPFLHQALVEADTHFWEKGEEYTVFDLGDLKVSTPICFEDTFGYISREFVKRGADVLVNLTNDSWSGSVSSMMQHGSMAVFRAVENRRSMVRSANGGWTAAISPNGEILGELEPFTQNFLTVDVPIIKNKSTFYTLYGDWLGILFLILALILVFWSILDSFFQGKLTRKLIHRKMT